MVEERMKREEEQISVVVPLVQQQITAYRDNKYILK